MNRRKNSLCFGDCNCRCGLSSHTSDLKLLSIASEELSIPLPAKVKAVSSETERVEPLEELTMRILHNMYSDLAKGEQGRTGERGDQ